VRVYMAQVYPQLRLAVLNVRGDIFDEISEMLVRILKVAEEHGPANWIAWATTNPIAIANMRRQFGFDPDRRASRATAMVAATEITAISNKLVANSIDAPSGA